MGSQKLHFKRFGKAFQLRFSQTAGTDVDETQNNSEGVYWNSPQNVENHPLGVSPNGTKKWLNHVV